MISVQTYRNAMLIHLNTRNLYFFLFIGVIFLVTFLLIVKSKYESEDLSTNENSFYRSVGHKHVLYNFNSIDVKKIGNEIYDVKDQWFFQKCLKSSKLKKQSEMSMENLKDYVEQFYQSKYSNCKKIYAIFNTMFELQTLYGEIRLDELFKQKVSKWLDGNPEYLKQIYNQKIIKLYNKYHFDEMIYNGIRGKRPQATQFLSEKNYTVNLKKESMKSCDFCGNNYKTNTASEIFDGIETTLTYTAANTFKYDKWHSLVVSRNHDTLNLSEQEMIDMFDVTFKWFEKVNKLDSTAIYPEAIWDAMPKSGASQIHTHLQASMGIDSYYGVMRRWIEASKIYFAETRRDYLDDFVLIHKALGLAKNFNNIQVIFNLIPLKDQELMIIAENNDGSRLEFSRIVHYIIRIFVDKFDQFSFSAGMYLPEYPYKSKKSFRSSGYQHDKLNKIFFKILFRSPVANLRSDFNGLDLYTSSVIGLDRYKLANKVFELLEQYKTK